MYLEHSGDNDNKILEIIKNKNNRVTKSERSEGVRILTRGYYEMRWNEPKLRDKRVTRKFLFIPRCFNGEYRWLEFSYILEEYRFNDFKIKFWNEVGFATNKKDKKDTEGFL